MRLPRERFDYSASVDREPVRLPNGARIAVWTIVNVEEWNIEAAMPRTVLTMPAGVSVVPDVPNWSWHEYGMRVGFWRLKAALDKHNVKATMAVNAAVCLSYPRLANAALSAGWEFMGHGYTQKALHLEADQRATIRKSIETIRKFTGKPPRGWLGPGLTETWETHSNGRIERFLQIAAEDNIQISQPSTSAQYFHLLRRQALRSWRKPLIVFTPKSMLRLPAAGSPLKDLTRPRFMPVLPDQEHEDAERVLVCSGKIGHELRAERERRGDAKTAIVFLEQLYPFPEKELTAHLRRHRRAKEIVWIQEEPANMGALRYVMPGLEQAADGLPVRSVKRSASASPATGSARAHEVEQRALLTLALDTGAS